MRVMHGIVAGLFGMAITAVGEVEISVEMPAEDFPWRGTAFYLEEDHGWLAVDPDRFASAEVEASFPGQAGVYDVTFHGVGENDGRSRYRLEINGESLGEYQVPLTEETYAGGERFDHTWNDVALEAGDRIRVVAVPQSEGGGDSSRARWAGITFTRPLRLAGPVFALLTPEPGIYGERKQWHRITFAFAGPATHENATPNPFLDFELNLTLRHESGYQTTVPGYYAADGCAGESRATGGRIWRAHFMPGRPGRWEWNAAFTAGRNAAVVSDPDDRTPTAFHGETGAFLVLPSDKTAPDFRARGLLEYAGTRYLRFAQTGEYFLKGGADSPENFLAYDEFDGTGLQPGADRSQRSGEAEPSRLHHYQPHVQDWQSGDPQWHAEKGKGIIGALNYLAGKGMNSVYFLTMNVDGDGRDVWPWVAADDPLRFDCSKLDQWEIVFSHMDRLGLMLHVVTQETENDQLLDSGMLGLQRRLYYRELIARFAHHPAMVWNLGEENTNTHKQRKDFSRFFKTTDPYRHPVVVHTYPGQYRSVYTPLLGYPYFDGVSLQMGNMKDTHSETIRWIRESAATQHPWIACLDEIGPANTGAKPDAEDFGHAAERQYALWGNLMAGGAGVEWYFGYRYPNNDLNCEDWRSRDHLWDLTRIALRFFSEHLPYAEMENADSLTSRTDDYCLARRGEIYAVYLPVGEGGELNLEDYTADFRLFWFDPRNGGPLQPGTPALIQGPGRVALGAPPSSPDRDWVALIRKD